MNTKEFIEKARKVHGDKYDYSKVEYVNSKTNVCIICPEHGEFWQRPSSHLKGAGCKKCAHKILSSNQRMPLDDFIKKAKEVHGDKYDYSKTKYKKANEKVCITCPKHGDFWQTPNSHLRGSGCPKCSGNFKKTTEWFINKAREVHGDKYDYSKTEYIKAKEKVCIICPEHGEFLQEAYSHLLGYGCPKCGQNYHMTTEEFIADSKKLYPNKIKYNKCQYVNSQTKVKLYCTEKDENGKEHGYYTVYPSQHLHGSYGCKKCQYEKIRKNKTKTNEQFICESKNKFGNRFKYDKCNYTGVESDVTLYCTEEDENGKEHGYFTVKSDTHLHKKNGGCPKCYTHKYTTESWVKRAKLVHGETYDYSKTDLDNRDEMGRVLITCRIHGDFWQSPANHLQGLGCTNCTHGLTKKYKFNLLKEFENEYELRSFLENNDVNILYVILRNIEPKFESIKGDIEKALKNIGLKDPIQELEDKYAKGDEEETEETSTDTKEEEATTVDITNVDLDDDDAVNDAIGTNETENKEDTNTKPTIEDVVKNTEKELEVISKIEHMLTPEDREYIMEKFLNDKLRDWMAKREVSKCN